MAVTQNLGYPDDYNYKRFKYFDGCSQNLKTDRQSEERREYRHLLAQMEAYD